MRIGILLKRIKNLSVFTLGNKIKYFIFRACWSQTDQDIYIIQADNKESAMLKINRSPLNPHHWEYVGKSDNNIL